MDREKETKKEEAACPAKKEEEAVRPAAAPRRRSFLRRLFKAAALVLILIALILLSLPWFLPALVEWKVNEILTGLTEQSDGCLRAEVREIGLFRTSFSLELRRPASPETGDLRFTEDDFGIASASLTYSPADLLFRSRVDSVRIDGVRLPLLIRGKTFVCPVWEKLSRKLKRQKSDKKSGKIDPVTLPFSLRSFELNGAVLIQVEEEDGKFLDSVLLPVECIASLTSGSLLKYHMSIRGSANRIDAAGFFNLSKMRLYGGVGICFDSELLPFAVRSRMNDPRNRGEMAGTVAYELDLNDPLGCKVSGRVSGRIRAFASDAAEILWTPGFDFAMSDRKITLNAEDLQIRCAGEDVTFRKASCIFDLDSFHGHGTLDAAFGRGPELSAEYEFRRTAPEGAWDLRLASREAAQPAGSPTFSLSAGQGRMTAGRPDFTIRSTFAGVLQCQGAASIRDIRFEHPAWTLELGGLSLDGSGSLDSFQAGLKAESLVFAYGGQEGGRAVFPSIRLQAEKAKESGIRLTMEADDGSFVLSKFDLSLKGISFRQTAFPLTGETGKGSFRIGEILMGKKSLGSLQAETDLRETSISARGELILCGVRADCRAEAAYQADRGFSASGAMDVPSQAIPGEALAELFPGPMGDKKVSGMVEINGEYAISGGKQSGSARIRLTDGAVTSESMKLSVEGIRGSVSFPSLPEIRTAPDQPLSCRTIRFGNIVTDGARVKFRLDSLTRACLERMNLNWCGGKVRMECTYFESGSDAFSVTIHCDRLDLIQFLTQTGAGAGEGNGNGRISGTLPVFFNRKTRKLSVRNAFLYSTPGEEGKIQFVLDESIRKSQEGSVTFDMTQDALRNFEYSWARVQMATESGALKLQLQLNGKPAAPLYYSYGANGIVKSAVPHVFQGIRLDVNLNVPLDVLFDLMEDYSLLNKKP